MRVGLITLLLLLLAGCQLGGPRATDGGLHSDHPAAKLYAIRQAGTQRDAAAVPDLVELLGDDDPAVRMMSIEALERITGERYGYSPYADAAEREPALRRWQQAVEQGRWSSPVAAAEAGDAG